MKKNSSSIKARVLAGLPFFLVSIFLVVLSATDLSATARARRTATNRTTTVSSVSPAVSVPSSFNGTYDPAVYPCATPRHQFAVPADQVRIVVQVTATVPTNDLTLTLLYGDGPNPIFIHTEDTGTSSEVYNYQPAGGLAPGTYQVQICQTPTT